MDKAEHSSGGHKKNKKRHRKRGHKNKSKTSSGSVNSGETILNNNLDTKDDGNAHEIVLQETIHTVSFQEHHTPDLHFSLPVEDSTSISDVQNCSANSEIQNSDGPKVRLPLGSFANDVIDSLPAFLGKKERTNSSLSITAKLSEPSVLKESLSTCPFLESLKLEEELYPSTVTSIPVDCNKPNSNVLLFGPELNETNRLLAESNLSADLPLESFGESQKFVSTSQKNYITPFQNYPSESSFPSVISSTTSNLNPLSCELANTSLKTDYFSSQDHTGVNLSSIKTLEKVVDALTDSLDNMEQEKIKISTKSASKPPKKNSVENKQISEKKQNSEKTKNISEKNNFTEKKQSPEKKKFPEKKQSPENTCILTGKSKDAGDGSIKVHTNKQGEKNVNESQKTSTKEIPVSKSDSVQIENTDAGESQKTKAELRAERRAKQEAQRAAKAALKAKSGTATTPQNNATAKPSIISQKKESKAEKTEKTIISAINDRTKPEKQSKVIAHRLHYFDHLPQIKKEKSFQDPNFTVVNNIHPAIAQLGLQYGEGIIVGSNARCLALLHSLRQVIEDYVTPSNKELHRDLEEKINSCMSYLQQQRPLSISMENAAKFLKKHITQIPTTLSDSEAKTLLQGAIDTYINDKFVIAHRIILQQALSTIDENEIIMIFGHSSLINAVLINAHKEGKKFEVIVVDSRPKMEGKKSLITLVREGIKCSYILITAISYAMPKVTKVFMGAHALLANCAVMGRIGSSQIALVANKFAVPVLICSEAHKFTDRVMADSFVYNELGNPEELVHTNQDLKHLENWQSISSISLLNVLYDITPPELISSVITEFGSVPCTSIPTVIRMRLLARQNLV